MSENTSELLKAFVEASDQRKNVALEVLRGQVTTCPYLRQGKTVIGTCEGLVEEPLLMGMGAAAKFIGVSRSTLWRAMQAGRVKRVELFPGSYRVRRKDLVALVAKDAVGPSGSRRGRPRRQVGQAEAPVAKQP